MLGGPNLEKHQDVPGCSIRMWVIRPFDNQETMAVAMLILCVQLYTIFIVQVCTAFAYAAVAASGYSSCFY